jgi:hypothetical protein
MGQIAPISPTGSMVKGQDDEPEPTEDEFLSLRHIGDKIPISAWLIAIVELAERFTCKFFHLF